METIRHGDVAKLQPTSRNTSYPEQVGFARVMTRHQKLPRKRPDLYEVTRTQSTSSNSPTIHKSARFRFRIDEPSTSSLGVPRQIRVGHAHAWVVEGHPQKTFVVIGQFSPNDHLRLGGEPLCRR